MVSAITLVHERHITAILRDASAGIESPLKGNALNLLRAQIVAINLRAPTPI